MVSLVRSTGQTGVSPSNVSRPSSGGRAAFTASDGTAIVVIADSNEIIAASSFGDHSSVSKIYVYTSIDRANWTLRATITTAAYLAKPNMWNAELFSDNSIGIIYRGDDGTVRYHKVTWSTWAVSASETVMPAAAGTVVMDCDIHISDGNIPLVGILRSNTTGTRLQASLFTRRTSDSTWFNGVNQTLLSTDNPDVENYSISVSVLQGGTTTARNVVFATSHGIASGSDAGCLVFSTVLNESSGAISAPSQRAVIGAGDILPKHSMTGPVRRVRLFTDAANTVTLGVMVPRSVDQALKTYFVKYSWNGTTWTVLIPVSSNLGDFFTNPVQGMSMSYGAGSMVFFYCVDAPPENGYLDTIVYIAKISAGSTIFWTGFNRWNNIDMSGLHQAHFFGNGQKNSSQSTFDMLVYGTASLTSYAAYHNYLQPVPAPINITPANNSTVNSSIPDLSGQISFGIIQYPQTQVKMVWQIASDSGFTTNLREIEQGDYKYQYPSSNSGPAPIATFYDIVPYQSSLTQGKWYVRATIEDATGDRDVFSTGQLFTVAHAPSATNLKPSQDSWVAYGTNGTVYLDWDFSDPSSEDFQTAFQILITSASDGATVFDSGKTSSNDTNGAVTIASVYKNVRLYWQVRVWDSEDVVGSYSTVASFYTGDAPTGTITAPANNSTVSSGTPTITITGNSARPLNLYRYTLQQSTTILYDSGLKQASGQTGAYTINTILPTGYLGNNRTYTLVAYVVDNTGMQSVQSTVTFTTSWALPATPTGLTVSTASYNVDSAGYISVQWSDTGRDAQFIAWNVYRRDDIIDPNTKAVLQTGAWQLMTVNNTVGSIHEFRDFTAPSGYGVVYRVTQVVSRSGDIVESANADAPTVYPAQEGYFLLDKTGTTAFYLNIVTGDSYEDQYEESEFTIDGRGRFIERGEHIGLSGTLTVQLRNSTGVTARQKKQRLETMKEDNNVLYLRTPFGDLYRVSVGNMTISRIAGVGLSEFCDVTLPYREVGT